MDNQNLAHSMVEPTPNPAPIPPAQLAKPSKNNSLGMVISLILVSLIAATFVGLFVWMYIQWDEVKTDVDGQINAAVAIAVNENTIKKDAEFEEKEKNPYTSFAGPEDYGELSFEYPRTWSLYVKSDASSGGTYEAYLNPGGVQPVSNTTVSALHVQILDRAFDSQASTYQSYVDSGKMTMRVVKVDGENANYYEGTLPSTMNGILVLIRIRDKTAIIETNSMLFKEDFDKLITTIKYNS